MSKNISILTILFLCLMFGINSKSYAQPVTSPTNLMEKIKGHIDKVKISNPGKYQEMMEKTGGNPTDCTDCHQEVLKGNLPSQKGIESIRPLRK